MIEHIRPNDLSQLLRLYTYLGNEPAEISEAMTAQWQAILRDPKIHILASYDGSVLTSSCMLTIIPNLTHHQRPYALIENVVTDPQYRGRGLAGACLAAAVEIARKQHCYKVMLMTGSRRESTLRFYEKVGFRAGEKTAFLYRLDEIK